MGYGYLRRAAIAVICVAWAACGAAACGGKGGEPAGAIGGGGSLEAPEPALAEALQAEPFGELTFVPFDSEAIVRVDLAALAAGDTARENALDFMLRAQQPLAWETLRGGGIHLGREIRAIYLVIGPRVGLAGSVERAAGDGEDEQFLLAGVGTFDVARLELALAMSGASVDEVAGGARVYSWIDGAERKIGAALPLRDTRMGSTAIGVTDGLILVGRPDPVRRALAARAGQIRDARRGPLAHELLHVDGAATAWGVAVAGGQDAYVATLMPGLVTARFHSSMAMARPGEVALRAEFVDAARAEAFRGDLARTLDQLKPLADASPVGATLTKLRETGVTVQGAVVTTGAPALP